MGRSLTQNNSIDRSLCGRGGGHLHFQVTHACTRECGARVRTLNRFAGADCAARAHSGLGACVRACVRSHVRRGFSMRIGSELRANRLRL